MMKKLNQFFVSQQIQSKSQNLLGNQLKIESGELNMPPPFIPIDEDNIASIDIDTLQAFKANLEKQLEIIDQSSSDIASPQSTHSNTPVVRIVFVIIIHNTYSSHELLCSLTESCSRIKAVNKRL